MHDDLELRTVVFQGDPDQMGVVVYDSGGERVKVDFGDGHLDEALLSGRWVDRADLKDVTEIYDYAKAWGLVDENE